MEEKTERKYRKFDLYCHYHKHLTKIIGYPLECEKCMEERFKKELRIK